MANADRVVEVDKVVVRGADGTPCAVFGRHVDGSVGLEVSDQDARPRLIAGVDSEGEPLLELRHECGSLACRLTARKGAVGLSLNDRQNLPRMAFTLDEHGDQALTFASGNGVPRIGLGVTADGLARIDLYDSVGRLRLRLTIADDDTPGLTLTSKDESPSAMLIVGADGSPGLMFMGRDGPRLAVLSPPDCPTTVSLIDPSGRVSFQAP